MPNPGGVKAIPGNLILGNRLNTANPIDLIGSILSDRILYSARAVSIPANMRH
jgi:hypothetical protein